MTNIVQRVKKIPLARLACVFFMLNLTACTYEVNHHYPKKPSKADNLVMDTNVVAYYPYNIELYTLDNIPTKPYHFLGEISANQYNEFGIKRQRARINQVLRQEAGELGGDAVIVLNPKGTINMAEVIQFNQVGGCKPKASA
jgi:hypothetical protein